jgi:hypothetical protein
MQELVEITGERLIEIFTSNKFLSAVRRSKGICDHEKGFEVYHEFFKPVYLVTKICSGTSHYVDTTECNREAEKKMEDPYWVVDVHYHDFSLMPSYRLSSEGPGDLGRLHHHRIYPAIEVNPILCTGISTKDSNVPFLLIQETISPQVDYSILSQHIEDALGDIRCSIRDGDYIADKLNQSGLYKARSITFNTKKGPSDLEKIAEFAFKPRYLNTKI